MTNPSDHYDDIEFTPLQSLVLWALISMLVCAAAGFSAALLYLGWVQYF